MGSLPQGETLLPHGQHSEVPSPSVSLPRWAHSALSVQQPEEPGSARPPAQAFQVSSLPKGKRPHPYQPCGARPRSHVTPSVRTRQAHTPSPHSSQAHAAAPSGPVGFLQGHPGAYPTTRPLTLPPIRPAQPPCGPGLSLEHLTFPDVRYTNCIIFHSITEYTPLHWTVTWHHTVSHCIMLCYLVFITCT